MQKRLRNLIHADDRFVITAEFVPLPGHSLANFEKFLAGYRDKQDQLPDGLALAGVTIPQSPGGVASMSPLDVYAILDRQGLWADLDVIPHVTAKDQNLDAIETYLVGLRKMGLESILCLTGDKPATSKGVFEVDSLGLIEFVKEMNNLAFDKAKAGEFDKVHQFYIAAAVSQFKYTEASQMQQYFKMAKKLRVGADALMTQVGWDYRKSEELKRYLAEEGLAAPVLGNVYFLTTMTPAPRLMHEGKLPGCVVTRELFEKLQTETPEQHLNRAAQQVAMYRDLGYAGADIGGIFDFDMLVEILQKADEIGPAWRENQDNLAFGPADGWYLYDDSGQRRPLSRPRRKLSQRNFNLFHHMLFEPGKGVRGPVKKLFSLSRGMREGAGGMETAFHALFEKPMKSLLFHCEECGDCFLYENFSVCSMGCCEKGLDNTPCGDANPDGTCGNDPNLRCVGELIYQAAASGGPAGLKQLAERINPHRNPQLAGKSSILNNFFGRDHCRRTGLIQIGDNIHAHIPKVGAALAELLDKGDDAFRKPSGALAFIIALISAQAKHRADFIQINVDKFLAPDAAAAVRLAEALTGLIRQHGQGVPLAIDATDVAVAAAALQTWRTNAPDDLAAPLLKVAAPEALAAFADVRRQYAAQLLYRLPAGQTAATLHEAAWQAAQQAPPQGLALGELFFELPITPIMQDYPEPDAAGPGRTYETFQAIARIAGDRRLKGTHIAAGVADCAKKAPGRSIGIMRAYVARAQRDGLDAILADVTKDFGWTPAGDDLIDLIDALARQDGAEPARQRARAALDAFCAANQKAARKPSESVVLSFSPDSATMAPQAAPQSIPATSATRTKP